jgi:hypothetical protein
MDSSHRASIGACAAVDAGIRIDMINVTFVDSTLRAFACASAASYTISFRNLVSHNIKN